MPDTAYDNKKASHVQDDLAEKLTELLGGFCDKINMSEDIDARKEAIKLFKDSAISKFKKARALIEGIAPSEPEGLDVRIAQAQTALFEVIETVGLLDAFVSEIQRVSVEGKEEIKEKVREVLKAKHDDKLDKWVHILHLSDLHFGNYYYSQLDTEKDDKNDYFAIVKDQLFSFLNEFRHKHHINIDVIAITGDISCRNNPKGYDDFKEWLKALCASDMLDLDIEKDVILCAGNHDSGYKDRSEYGIMAHAAVEKDKALITKSVESILSIQNISARVDQFKLFNNVCTSLNIAKLNNFNMPADKSSVDYLIGTREHKGLNFVVLNTAWNSFPNKTKTGEGNGYNHGNLFIGGRLITQLEREQRVNERDENKITVTLFHHPLSWLHESELRTYGDDQKMPVVKKVRGFSDIILNGHVHGKIEPPDILANKTLVFSGGSLNTDDSPAFQFEIISINKTQHYCTQRIVTYNHQQKGEHEQGWEDDTENALTPYYYGAYKTARELFAMISLDEVTLDEVLSSVNGETKKAFLEFFKKSKYLPFIELATPNPKETIVRESQQNKVDVREKTISKERDEK